MAINVLENGRGGKCVYKWMHAYVWITKMEMRQETEDKADVRWAPQQQQKEEVLTFCSLNCSGQKQLETCSLARVPSTAQTHTKHIFCHAFTSFLALNSSKINMLLYMCVLFYSSFFCISAYANVYFKTTIIKENIKITLIAGVPSSQALPGFLITAPPSVCVSVVLGALPVWIQNQKKTKRDQGRDKLRPWMKHRGFRREYVCCFVLLTRSWGIVTVPGPFLQSGDLGWPDPHRHRKYCRRFFWGIVFFCFH